MGFHFPQKFCDGSGQERVYRLPEQSVKGPALLFYYVEKNVDDVRDALALMVSGVPVRAKIREYAASSMSLTTKEEIFSAMVVYGFLSSEQGKVFIPNKELMDQFEEMLLKEPSLGYVYRLAKESERMLAATISGDTDTMLSILEYAHNTEIPLLSYSNETDLVSAALPGKTGGKADVSGADPWSWDCI